MNHQYQRLEPNELLMGYVNPAHLRNGLLPGLTMEQYQAMPGFNPSLVKLADPRLKTPDRTRGHPLRVLASLAGQLERKETKYLDLGTLYHALLFEPGTVDQRFAVVTEELKEELLEKARERKVDELAPKEFSFRFGEAKAWRAEHGAKAVPSEAEKEAILEQARERVRSDVEFHARLTELSEWKEEQAHAGRTVIDLETKQTAERMVGAIFEDPVNAEVASYLKDSGCGNAEFGLRAEVSCFATMRISDTVVQMKGRPDFVPCGPDWLDPKSGLCCHPRDFSLETKNRGYDVSMGAYAAMFELLAKGCDRGRLPTEMKEFYGLPKKRGGFLVQESSPPYLATIYWLDWREQMDGLTWLNYGASRFLDVLETIVQCYESGNWRCETEWGGGTLEPPFGYDADISLARQVLGGNRESGEEQRAEIGKSCEAEMELSDIGI